MQNRKEEVKQLVHNNQNFMMYFFFIKDSQKHENSNIR